MHSSDNTFSVFLFFFYDRYFTDESSGQKCVFVCSSACCLPFPIYSPQHYKALTIIDDYDQCFHHTAFCLAYLQLQNPGSDKSPSGLADRRQCHAFGSRLCLPSDATTT